MARQNLPIFLALTLACAPTGSGDSADSANGDSADGVAAQPTTGEHVLRWRTTPDETAASPPRLTASDGTGLKMVSLSARAFIEDPVALTELRMTFVNTEARVREGRFEIDLPPGAAISRFAMKIDGRWQEAEVVERQAARRAYEDALHRRQDPALMEHKAGNQFRARVFPIPANGTKEIIVSYSQRLDHSTAPYRIHLQGLPKLDSLDAQVVVGDGGAAQDPGLSSSRGGQAATVRTLSLSETAFSPRSDLEVAIESRSPSVGLRNGRLALARVAPVLDPPPDPIDSLTVLFDTSASRALGWDTQLRRLSALLAAIERKNGGRLDVRVVAFDQHSVEVYRGPGSGFADEGVLTLRQRGAMGASDLTAALRRLASEPQASERILVVTDGIVTAGQVEHEHIRAAVTELGKRGTRRVDALVVGGIRDDVLLGHLVDAGLPRAGIVADGRLAGGALVHKLTQATRSGVKVTVPGAEWVWPRTLDGLQPGDEVMVFAELPTEHPFEVEFSGLGSVTVATRAAPQALLDRALARAEIDRLSTMMGEEAAGDPAKKATLQQRILQLSTRHRVLSEYTAMLVLETDADYARFGIARDALADILTVGAAGIDVVDRTQAFVPKPIAVVTETATKNDWFDGDSKDKEKSDKKEGRALRLGGAGGDDAMRGAPGDAADVDLLPAGLEEEKSAEQEAPAERAEPPSAPEARPSPPPRPDGPNEPEPEADEDRTGAAEAPQRARAYRPARRRPPRPHDAGPLTDTQFETGTPKATDAWDGEFGRIMGLVAQGRLDEAKRAAATWRDREPGSELALLVTGEVAEAMKDWTTAARAYGSLIDLFPSRADIRRMAGQRLERLAQVGGVGLDLAIDAYRQAVAQRPDHPASHRLLAFALAKADRHAEAFDAIEAGAKRSYPGGRFRGVPRILADDVGLLATAWRAHDPGATKNLTARLDAGGWRFDESPSTRFVLVWETDANDVDFHIFDGRSGHAYFSRPRLKTGGELYADVTTGYGPECFTIRGTPTAYPYTLQAHYYSRGPMGYGMGKLQVVQHDGKGELRFDEQPFAIMKDGATVALGTLTGPLPAATPDPRTTVETVTPPKNR